MILTVKQSIALDRFEDQTTKEIIFGGGAGGGKSILGTYCLLKNSLKYPNTRWLMGRSKLKTLKETTLNSFIKVAAIQGVNKETYYKINNQNNTINFYNGSQILMKDLFYYPSDPDYDELGSLEIAGAFIDEVNQIPEKAWNIVKSRIREGLDENGLIPKILGSCNPSKTWVYNNFYKPQRDNYIDSNKIFIQSLIDDNTFISKHYKENLSTLDEVSKQRLLYGNWEYSEDDFYLMKYEKIVDMFSNHNITLTDNYYITCDVARLGNDKTIIRVWNGKVSIKKIKLEKKRTTEVVEAIKQLMQEYNISVNNVVVDEDGVGGGVVDMLGCCGFVNNSSPLTDGNYQNLRSECYCLTANDVNDNLLYLQNENITDRQIITEEFEILKKIDVEKDGKIKVIGREAIKQIIGRSPDEASCIMMRKYFDIRQVNNNYTFINKQTRINR